MVFLSFLDGFGKAFDDVSEEGDGELGRIALEEIESRPRGEWRALIVWVVTPQPGCSEFD